MILHLVPNKQMLPKERTFNDVKVFRGVHILQSFYYCDAFTEDVIIPNCGSFMLDSGAFTFITSARGKRIDWNEYASKYAAFIKKNNIKKYFEIDIDKIVGYERVKELRHRIEAETGVPSIPVWHRSRGYEEYLRLCDQYKYVAIGGIAAGEIKKNEHYVFLRLIEEAHKRGAKVHGLGFTDVSKLEKYHFDSVDSSTWAAGNRFGHLYKFDGKTIKTYRREKGKNVADHRKFALHNFEEWVKFQKYAEKYL